MGGVKGVVLCGGPGKRLRPITYYFQKAIIPIGKRQKPLMEYVVRLLKHHGITDLVFLVDYKAEQIVNYFDEGSRFDVKITYVYDDPKFKGTAGSLLNAYKKGALSEDDLLLIYYGDILTNMNLSELLALHEEKSATSTVALAQGFTVRVGVANLEGDGRIIGFQEKPRLKKPVSIGILTLEGDSLKEIEALKGGKTQLDIMGEVVPYLIRTGKRVYGYLTDAFWYDVGSIEAYEKLDVELVDKLFSYLFDE